MVYIVSQKKTSPFYRATLYAERGYATVHPSVWMDCGNRFSRRLEYFENKWLISFSFVLGLRLTPTSAIWSNWNIPKIRVE